MKQPAFDDPMELVGVGVAGGDFDAMAECVIEEYLLLGWSERQLMGLFKHPFFRATHQVYRLRGEAHARALIARVLARWQAALPASLGSAAPGPAGPGGSADA